MLKIGLLIVDMQVAFYPPDELVDELTIAMQHSACTVFTRFINRPDSIYRSHLRWSGCAEGDRSSELVMVPGKNLVITKYGYGLTAEHIGMIKAQGMDGWYIGGVDTESCVLACAFSLWDAGIPCSIRSELSFSSTGLDEAALRIATRNFLPSGVSHA